MKKVFDYAKHVLIIVVPTILLALPLSYCSNERCPEGDCLPEGYAWKGDTVKVNKDTIQLAKK